MINIYVPSDDAKEAVVHGIITATGRPVQFIATSGLVVCPRCGGTDPFCPVCQGQPKVDLPYTHEAIAAVRWKSGEVKTYRPHAQTIDGDCQIILILDDVIERVLRQTRYVIVDERQCVINGWHRKGAPPNRIHVILREDEDLGGHRVG